jgi:hypothetical protein
MIGSLAVGLTLTAVHGIPVCGRLVSSAQNFQQCFKSIHATNPVERLVFSLMLANSKTTPTKR